MQKIAPKLVPALAVLALLPMPVVAQEYTQVEVWTMSRLPGHTADIGAAMVDHNAEFHAAAPNGASAYYMLTGSRADKFQYVVGPRTFSDMDGATLTPEHMADWDNSVMRDAVIEEREFWRRVDEVMYTPENLASGARPVSVVRLFEVADADAFVEQQRQVVEVVASMGSPNPRTLWRRIGLKEDNWGWAVVTTYPNWAALDGAGADFEAAYRALHGDGAWDDFLELSTRAITNRQDSHRVMLTGN